MIDIRTGKSFTAPQCESLPGSAAEGVAGHITTRRDAIKTGLAAIIATGCAPSLVGPANATVGGAARGMMRGVAIRVGMMDKKEDNRWAQEVMDKTYPTAYIIEEHHNAKYTEELTKTYGGN